MISTCHWTPPLRVFCAGACADNYAGYGIYAETHNGRAVYKYGARLPPSMDQTLECAQAYAIQYVAVQFAGKSYELCTLDALSSSAVAKGLARAGAEGYYV